MILKMRMINIFYNLYLMRKKYFYLLFLTLISCNTSNNDQSTEQIRQLKKNDDSILFNLKQLNNSADTIQQKDTLIHLIINNDTAYYKKGQTLLDKRYIRTKTIIGGDGINPKEIQDEAFIIANCLIILREIKSAGHFCHIPEVERVEIYTQNGGVSIIKQGDSKSKSLMGFDFTSNFLGNRFSSPKGTWGLITIEAEGDIYGFLIISSDGNVNEKYIYDKVSLESTDCPPAFNENDELVWAVLSENGAPVNFVVNSKGDYKFIKK